MFWFRFIPDMFSAQPPFCMAGHLFVFLLVWLFIILSFIGFYYIDTDEIPGFLLLLKNRIFTARSEDTIFIFHV